MLAWCKAHACTIVAGGDTLVTTTYPSVSQRTTNKQSKQASKTVASLEAGCSFFPLLALAQPKLQNLNFSSLHTHYYYLDLLGYKFAFHHPQRPATTTTTTTTIIIIIMAKKRISTGGSVLEVNIASLEGIGLQNPADIRFAREGFAPQVTASVAFSGSVSDMEVGSSSVCGRTGQLQVESEALHIDQTAQFSPDQCWLRAEWNDPASRHKPKALSSLGHAQPHLRVQLPNPTNNTLGACSPDMDQTNRDHSNNLHTPLRRCDSSTSTSTTRSSSNSSSPVSTNSSTATSKSTNHHSTASRGPSVVWSNAGAAVLPEIVELFVRLKSPLSGFVEETGVAYLVVFGNEQHRGKFIMDLPIKRPSQSLQQHSPDGKGPSLVLSDQAKLRVIVKVRSLASSSSSSSTSSRKSSSLNTSVSTATTASETTFGTHSLPKLASVSSFRLHSPLGSEVDKDAWAMLQARNQVIDVEIPPRFGADADVDDDDDDDDDDEDYDDDDDDDGLLHPSVKVCSVMIPSLLNSLVQTLSCSVLSCGDHRILRQTSSNSSMDSTISTRQSLGL